MSESTKTASYQNPATSALIKIKEKEQERKRAISDAGGSNLAELMKIEVFRKTVNQWLKACGIDDPINSKNSNEREQALGKREIGLQIKKELEQASPALYDLMVDEARDNNKKGDSTHA